MVSGLCQLCVETLEAVERREIHTDLHKDSKALRYCLTCYAQEQEKRVEDKAKRKAEV